MCLKDWGLVTAPFERVLSEHKFTIFTVFKRQYKQQGDFLFVGNEASDEWNACFVTKGNGQINISNASGSVSTSLLAVKDLQTANPDEAFTAPARD